MNTVTKSIAFHRKNVNVYAAMMVFLIIVGLLFTLGNENYKNVSYVFFSFALWSACPLGLSYRDLKFLHKNQKNESFLNINLPEGYVLGKK